MSVMDRALISLERCRTYKGVVLNCNGTDEFEADPDIAGQGVINVFAGVTFLACAMSAVYLVAQVYDYRTKVKPAAPADSPQDHQEDSRQDEAPWRTVFEKTLISFSDQQLFTGLAFALALRYYQGCMISAYHYDIVTNMLLMTCATHLVVVAVVSRYFDKAWILAILRLLLIFVVFVLTGLLFTNADAARQPPFPTKIEATPNALFTYPAVCFQSSGDSLADLIDSARNDGAAAFLQSKVNNTYVQNINLYIVAMLTYGFALIRLPITLLTTLLFQKPKTRQKFWKCMRPFTWVRAVAQFIMLVVGIVVACWAYWYIFSLRQYMDGTGFLTKNDVNPETSATTFGQLVPIFLTLLTVFTIIENFSEKAKGPLYVSRSEIKNEIELERMHASNQGSSQPSRS